MTDATTRLLVDTASINAITDIQPKLSSDPLRSRAGEPWLDWAAELYAHTLSELAMTPETWAAYFGQRHPGDGYAKTLQAQELRLRSEILRATTTSQTSS